MSAGRKSKVVLVSLNRERTPCPVIPLGLGYVADALLQAGHEVSVVDLALRDDGEPEAAAAEVAAASPSAVGLSLRNIDSISYPEVTWYLPPVRDFVVALRRATAAPLFIGGSAFSLCPEETLDYLGLDLGLAGEGERGAVRLVEEVLLGGGTPAGIPGAVYRDEKGQIQRVPPEIPGPARDELAPTSRGALSSAARDLLDIPRYLKAGAQLNVQTKRGCPLSCSYCVYPLLEGPGYRLREPAAVVDEVEAGVKRYGARRLAFVDNVFNLPPSHAKGICRELNRRRLDLRWEAYFHPAGLDDELAGLLADSGLLGLELTPDSGSPRMLAAYRKGIRVPDLERAAALSRSHGIPLCFYFLFGGPGETWETVDETFALADRLEPTAVVATLGVRVLPGTEVHRAALAEGVARPGASLLEPLYFVSPTVRGGFEEGILKRVGSRPNWIVPGLGVNYSPALFEVGRRFGPDAAHWRHVARLTSSHRRPLRGNC